LQVDKAVLFGSYAKGYATRQSDIDICFFLRDYNGKRRVDVITQILGIGGKKYRGAFFEPVVFETSEMQNDNPFVREILASGIDLLPETSKLSHINYVLPYHRSGTDYKLYHLNPFGYDMKLVFVKDFVDRRFYFAFDFVFNGNR